MEKNEDLIFLENIILSNSTTSEQPIGDSKELDIAGEFNSKLQSLLVSVNEDFTLNKHSVFDICFILTELLKKHRIELDKEGLLIDFVKYYLGWKPQGEQVKLIENFLKEYKK